MSDCVSSRIARRTRMIPAAFVLVVVGAFMARARAADTVVTDWPSYASSAKIVIFGL